MTRAGGAGRPLCLLGLLLSLLAAGARADLDSLAGTGGQQGQAPVAAAPTGDGPAAEQVQASEEAAAALASVEPANMNPLLGSLLIPQWKDDLAPDTWVGQGELFLKNQDKAGRALCNVTYTVRVNFAQDQMMAGVRNLSILGTLGSDMHQDLLWLRGKFPQWMPRLPAGEQLNVAYTIKAPASALPAFGAFFVESAAFCPDGAGSEGQKDQAQAAAAIVRVRGAGSGGQTRRRHQQRRALRGEGTDNKAAGDADVGAGALESWAGLDDNFLHNPLDGRWYVQSQTRLNNTDAAKGRCNVRFTMALDNLKTPGGGGGGANAGDVRVEEGYLVNVTMNAASGLLEGTLAPKFNRMPPGRSLNVGMVLSAATQEALSLSNFTVISAEAC